MDYLYTDVGKISICVDLMNTNRTSGDKGVRSGWTSDDQEVASVVDDYISLYIVPPEVADEAEKLRDSGHPQQALDVLLGSPD
jgi:hypothetical protein